MDQTADRENVSDTPSKRRSPCPVSCALDLFGDRWTLLVIRDLMLGKSRYKEFAASPEGIPSNILADRLERLVTHGIASRERLTSGKRHGYHLTEKGEALKPVLAGIRDWALRWEEGTEARLGSPPMALLSNLLPGNVEPQLGENSSTKQVTLLSTPGAARGSGAR